MDSQLNSKPLIWLLIGIVLTVLSHFRWPVGMLAWAAPAPFLVYLTITAGLRSRLLFLLALSVAFIGASLKVITPPLTWPMAIFYGLIAAFSYGAGYLAWDRLRRKSHPVLSHLTFAALQIAVEWLLHALTPFTAVGAAAYTQVDNLPFLQIASLFGIAGIGFLMYWFAAFLAGWLVYRAAGKIEGPTLLGLILAAHVFGAFRLEWARKRQTITVAAIGTDFKWMGPPLPKPVEMLPINEALFERSEAAARAGAQIVAWTEVATLVEKSNEAHLIRRGQRLADKYGVHLVMAYLMPIEKSPLLFENKLVWIDDHGVVDHTYLKHNPVPLEPSVSGDAPVKMIQTKMGKMAGAICYDFSFPCFARKYAIEEVDLVVLPSSENLGMEPLHPQIAAIRAIEGGYAILRPARFGRTTGIDPEGRFRGFVSDNESSQKTLLVTLPIERVQTLYAWIGDVFVYLFMGFIVLMIYNSLSRVGGICSAKEPNHGPSNAPISGVSPL